MNQTPEQKEATLYMLMGLALAEHCHEMDDHRQPGWKRTDWLEDVFRPARDAGLFVDKVAGKWGWFLTDKGRQCILNGGEYE